MLLFGASVLYIFVAVLLLMAAFPGCGERPLYLQAACEAHFSPWPYRVAGAAALVGFLGLILGFHRLLRHLRA